MLHASVADAPAEEDPLAVALAFAVAEDRPLGSAARMEPQVSIVQRLALVKPDIITDLEAEAVAVIVLGHDVAEPPAVAVLEEDRAGEVAVDVLVVVPVAVQHEILYLDIIDVLGREQGEDRRRRGILLRPEILRRQLVQEDDVAPDGRDCGAPHLILPGSRSCFRAQHDPAPWGETCGILHPDPILKPVGIPDEPGHNAIGLSQDGSFSGAAEGNMRMEVNGISHLVHAWQKTECAAPKTMEIVDAGLDDLVVGAPQVSLRLADRQLQNLPVSQGTIACGRGRCGDGVPVRANRCRNGYMYSRDREEQDCTDHLSRHIPLVHCSTLFLLVPRTDQDHRATLYGGASIYSNRTTASAVLVFIA